MLQSKSKLIPGQALIYTRANGVVYANYRDPPHNKIPKWIIGGDPDAVSKDQGCLFSYSQWQDMMLIAKENKTMKLQMKKLLNLYYLIKETK